MSEEEKKNTPAGSVGIFFGEGTSNCVTYGNTFEGIENPIVDHGTENKHLFNKAYKGTTSGLRERQKRRR